MKKEIKVLNEKAIMEMANKDYDAYQKQQKSYVLLNWLKDELVLRQVAGEKKFGLTPKSLSRTINILSLLRERNLTALDIKVADRETCIVSFELDMTTINNAERRRLNSYYNLNLEDLDEGVSDETYAHEI